jgi:predicted NAD/FAD-binding protein
VTVPQNRSRQKIAIIGSGIAGMSAAWLLAKAHDITIYESGPRIGGHSHTVEALTAAGPIAVDTGFIVYNAVNYPNLVALFDHLGVPTKASNMGFAVSLDGGRMEYGGDNLITLFSQPQNLIRPRFWSMLNDLLRFYREAPAHAAGLEADLTTLGDYLDAQGYGGAFQNDHLLPQAAAIWSASAKDIRDYPAAAFIRFCANHGLLKISDRPVWRTVEGGSRSYVTRLTADYLERIRLGVAAVRVTRTPRGVVVNDSLGGTETYDQVVIAAHADEGLAMVEAPTRAERTLLGAFSYSRNETVLHADVALMPKRKALWSAWNYLGRTETGGDRRLCVTYWMNRLQGLPGQTPLLVTLNPLQAPDPAKVFHTQVYEHPLFDAAAIRAQRDLWSVQGEGGVWWCGAYFGSGFHEDGLQAGLAVAEAISGVRRPWTVADESSRIHLTPKSDARSRLETAA